MCLYCLRIKHSIENNDLENLKKKIEFIMTLKLQCNEFFAPSPMLDISGL